MNYIIIIKFIYIGGVFLPVEFKAGCQRPAIKKDYEEKEIKTKKDQIVEEEIDLIKVGQPAPDFTIPAFHNGKFVELSLSEFKDKWVLLCFYPGDFTFV